MVKVTVVKPYFDDRTLTIRKIGEEVEVSDEMLRILSGENTFKEKYVEVRSGKEEKKRNGIKMSNSNTKQYRGNNDGK